MKLWIDGEKQMLTRGMSFDFINKKDKETKSFLLNFPWPLEENKENKKE